MCFILGIFEGKRGLWGLSRGRQNVNKGGVQTERAILVMIHIACDRGQ